MPQTLQLTPVGVVRSEITKPMMTADEKGLTLVERMDKTKEYYRRVKESSSQLEIFSPWVELLDGIEDFSHVLVLYWPHLIANEGRQLKKVHPMGRKDVPQKGVFATCSPARPNPVLVSAVPLVRRNGNLLEVTGFEALDGSPIIDVKPYSKGYMQVEGLRSADWMETLVREIEAE